MGSNYPTLLPKKLVVDDNLQQFDEFSGALPSFKGQKDAEEFDDFVSTLLPIRRPKRASNRTMRLPEEFTGELEDTAPPAQPELEAFDTFAQGLQIKRQEPEPERSALDDFDSFASSLPSFSIKGGQPRGMTESPSDVARAGGDPLGGLGRGAGDLLQGANAGIQRGAVNLGTEALALGLSPEYREQTLRGMLPKSPEWDLSSGSPEGLREPEPVPPPPQRQPGQLGSLPGEAAGAVSFPPTMDPEMQERTGEAVRGLMENYEKARSPQAELQYGASLEGKAPLRINPLEAGVQGLVRRGVEQIVEPEQAPGWDELGQRFEQRQMPEAVREFLKAGVPSELVLGVLEPKQLKEGLRLLRETGPEAVSAYFKATRRFPIGLTAKDVSGEGSILGVGKTTQAVGPDPTKQYDFRYRVADLDELVPSHTDTMAINLLFPKELQPRLRERAASQVQIDRIARELTPDALLGDVGQLDRGPMIVGPDMVVESGNGRVLALRRARAQYPEKLAEYQDQLRKRLPEYGIDPQSVEGMRNPVLVRERVSDVDRAKFAAEANEAAVLTMSPLEQALQDAGRIGDDALAALEIGENQGIDAALKSTANRDFVRGFMAQVPDNERAALVGASGELNPSGLVRLKSALFAKVYPGEAGRRLTQSFTESLDPGVKNIEAGMFGSLPATARAEGLIRAGMRDEGLSIAEDVSKAVDVLARLREQGMRVADYLGQAAMFERELSPFQENLLKYLSEIGRSPKKVRELLNEYASRVEQAPDPRQQGFFFAEPPTKEGIYESIIRGQAEREAAESPLFTFRPEAGPEPGVGAGAEAAQTAPAYAEGPRLDAEPPSAQRGIGPEAQPPAAAQQGPVIEPTSRPASTPPTRETEGAVAGTIARANERLQQEFSDIQQAFEQGALPLDAAKKAASDAYASAQGNLRSEVDQLRQASLPGLETRATERKALAEEGAETTVEIGQGLVGQPRLTGLDAGLAQPPRRPPQGQVPTTAPPMQPIPEGQLLPRFLPTGQIENWIEKQTRVKSVVSLGKDIPGVKGVVRAVDPWLATETHLDRVAPIFAVLEDQGNNIIRDAMVHLEAIPFTGAEIKGNRFVKGVTPTPEHPNASLAWVDVAERPYKYDMPDSLRMFFDTAHELIDDLHDWARAEGVKIKEIPFESGGHYFGRVAREVQEAAKQGRARPDMPRSFESMEAGIERGVIYEDDMMTTANAVFNFYVRRIIGKRMADLLAPLSRTPKELVEPEITKAAVDAAKRLRATTSYERVLKGIRDGMSPFYEVPTPGAEAGTRLRTQIVAMDRIKPGTAFKVFEVAQLEPGLQRAAELKALLNEAEAARKEAARVFHGARAKRTREIESIIKSPEPHVSGEKFGLPEQAINVRRVQQSFAAGRLFPRETADFLNREFARERSKALMAVGTVGAALQSVKAGMDFGVTTLHLLGLAGPHPVAYAKAMKNMYLSTLKPEVYAARMTRPDYVAFRRKMVPQGLTIEGPEYVEALERGGGMEKAVGLIGKLGEPGQKVSTAVQREGLKRAEMAFTAPLNIAKHEVGMALYPMFERAGKLEDLATFLNNLTGTRSSLAAGLGSGQRAIERVLLFFSPRFLRSALALVGDALEISLTSPKANEARKALLSYAGAMVLVPLAGRIALGQPVTEDFFNPTKPEFLSVELFGQKAGIGGVYRSLIQLAVNSYRTAKTDPSKFLDVGDRRENPLTRWWMSRSAIPTSLIWDVVERRDFLGEPLQTADDWRVWGGRAVSPFWAQEFITRPGEQAPELASLAAQLHGFRAIELSPAQKRDAALDKAAQAMFGKSADQLESDEWDALQRKAPEVARLRQEATETYARRGSPYHQYRLTLDAQRDQKEREIKALSDQLNAGRISGNEYRKRVSERERDIALLPGTIKKSNPTYAEALAELEKRGEPEPERGPLAAFLDAYYQIADEVADPRTGTIDVGELLDRRDELKKQTDPEIVKRAEAYINRNRAPEYVKALEEFRQYQKLATLSGMTSSQIREANKFVNEMRDLTRTMPPGARDSYTTFLRAAARNPNGARLYELQQAIDEAGIGELVQQRRQAYWASHPLLRKYFSDTPIAPERAVTGSAPAATQGFDFENYAYTVRD